MNRLTLAVVGTSFAAISFAACGDGNSTSKSSGDYCTIAKALVTSQQALDAQFEGSEEAPIADEFKGVVKTWLDEVKNLANSAPSEIAADMDTVEGAFTAFDKALQSVDYDLFSLFFDEAAAAAVEDDLAKLDSPEVQAAMDRVNDYTVATCGFALEDDGS